MVKNNAPATTDWMQYTSDLSASLWWTWWFSCPCASSCAVGALSQSQAHPLLGSLALPGRPLQPPTHAQLEHFLPLRVNSSPPLSLFPNFNTVRHCARWKDEQSQGNTKVKRVSLVWFIWETLVMCVSVCDLGLKISSHPRIIAEVKMLLKSFQRDLSCHWISKVLLIIQVVFFVPLKLLFFALCLHHPAIKQSRTKAVQCGHSHRYPGPLWHHKGLICKTRSFSVSHFFHIFNQLHKNLHLFCALHKTASHSCHFCYFQMIGVEIYLKLHFHICTTSSRSSAFSPQMDPVQKAVINHTFGVTPPRKKPIISCNICHLRFNSTVSWMPK